MRQWNNGHNAAMCCGVMQLVWPGQDLTKRRRTSRSRNVAPITFTRCRCSTVEPVTSAGLSLDGDDVTYFETYDGTAWSSATSRPTQWVKNKQPDFSHNFIKYRPIFKILLFHRHALQEIFIKVLLNIPPHLMRRYTTL